MQHFLADPREVAQLRRAMQLHLTLWGLPELTDVAQVCLTELVANVIRHVGVGTPTSLTVIVRDACIRIEVRDSDARALPTLLDATPDGEAGRGMAVVDAMSQQRWGVILGGDSKTVWCELACEQDVLEGLSWGPAVGRAAEHLSLSDVRRGHRQPGRASVAVAEEAAIDLIADLLHWLRAHGCDPDEALDRAQMHFEAEG
ncbi:ATP-binding protein [Streptomyces sp. NPDC046465]|uniref:ATP-binding protein n=1 Tax=Streptomyces sp. NPDC046465 TaxID=3155810 RepID=UPI0033D566C1